MEPHRRHSRSERDAFQRKCPFVILLLPARPKRPEEAWLGFSSNNDHHNHNRLCTRFVLFLFFYSGKLEISSAFLSDKYCNEKQIGESPLHSTPPCLSPSPQGRSPGRTTEDGSFRSTPWSLRLTLGGYTPSAAQGLLLAKGSVHGGLGPSSSLRHLRQRCPQTNLTKMVIHLRGFLSGFNLHPVEACGSREQFNVSINMDGVC